MPKTKKAAAAKKPASKVDLVAYYQAKLEAEWGPWDLKHVLDDHPESVVVLDTRDAESFEKEHLPHAVNIPGAELAARLKELPRNKAVVPYCWSVTCHLATRAALLLAQKGYRVHELAGGIGTWKEYGFEVKSAVQQAAAN